MTEENSKMMNPWQPLTVNHQQCQRCQIGPLKVWIYRDTHEWMLAYDYHVGEKKVVEFGVADEKPEILTWSQYIAGDEDSVIQFLPVMPDRPVVVRPKNPTKVIKGLECVLYVFIPVSINIAAGVKGELKLCEIPSVLLSNTWFGDTMSGELCYSMRFPAELSANSSAVGPHRVICPVKIKNKSEEDLEFQRLCLRGEHLNIYEGKQCHWSNEVRVTYEGDSQACEIKYLERPPNYEETGKLITKCRTPAPKGLFHKAFGGLKSWPF